MPSKKRKYNARFPAGRIKKIMQTDEEVGKVAQAVPIIISRTLELFVESLLSKALQMTITRNAKTLSPSHIKQCILAESRFDFLRDMVKNIPDVSAAEEKEMQMSAESSPNSSRFSDTSVPRRVVREDSNSSSSCDVKLLRENHKGALSTETEVKPKVESFTSNAIASPNDTAIDLTTRAAEEKPIVPCNFYQETFIGNIPHKGVITVNPTYTYQQLPQPSTSSYTTLAPVQRVDVPKIDKTPFFVQCKQNSNAMRMIPPLAPLAPGTPISPILNIDFSKNISQPEIKALNTNVASFSVEDVKNTQRSLYHHNLESHKSDSNNKDNSSASPLVNHSNIGNLQIDEDYDT